MVYLLINYTQVEYLPVISPLENMKENAVQLSQRVSHIIQVVWCYHSSVKLNNITPESKMCMNFFGFLA